MLVVVSHGVVLRAALAVLRDAGAIDLDGEPPHLANGEWLNLGYCVNLDYCG
jgi:hypothetical protein